MLVGHTIYSLAILRSNLSFEPIMQYIEDIQNFGMNMSFMSSSEAKTTYFNDIYFFCFTR